MNADSAYVDPVLLTEFADALEAMAAGVADQEAFLSHALSALGQSFQDRDYEDFRQHFMHSREHLLAFVEQIQQQTPTLRHDAEFVKASQQVRIIS